MPLDKKDFEALRKATSEKAMQTNNMQYEHDVRLSTVQTGDVAVLRCGGECEITKRGIYSAGVFLDGVALSYYENGNKKDGSSDPHPFDIIAIKRKPFDWSQVNPGMAFRDMDKEYLLWYIGEDFSEYDCIVASLTDAKISKSSLVIKYKHQLTRAPEHDVEVE